MTERLRSALLGHQCRQCSLRFTGTEELDKHRFLCHPEAATATAHNHNYHLASVPAAASRQSTGPVLSALENQPCSENDNANDDDSNSLEPPDLTLAPGSAAAATATNVVPLSLMPARSEVLSMAHISSASSAMSAAATGGVRVSKGGRIRPRVTCNRCLRTFARRSNLNAHLKSNCPAGRSFATASSSSGASAAHALVLSSASPAKRYLPSSASTGFVCQLCGNRYAIKSSFNRHMRMHRARQQQKAREMQHQHQQQQYHQLHSRSVIKSETSARVPTRAAVTPKQLECPLCRESASSEIDLISHLTFIHNRAGQLSMCSVCRQICLSSGQLRRHAAISGCHRQLSQRPHRCAQCGRRYARPEQLAAHAIGHLEHSERPHKCPLCPQVTPFNWRFELLEHSARHAVRA